MKRPDIPGLPSRSDAERMFEISVDLLSLCGVDGYFKRVNPAFERTLGYSAEELLASPFWEFIHPDDRAASESEVAKTAAGAPCTSFENRYRCKDGSYRLLSWRSSVPDAQGICYAVARDITDQRNAEIALRKAEDSLRQTEQQFWTAFELSGVGMAIGDETGRFVRVNRVLCEMLGYSEAELLGLSAKEITYPGDPVALRQAAAASRPALIEKRFLHKSGRPVWTSVSIAAVPNGSDGLAHQVGIVSDITERKETEAALRRSDAEMRDLVGELKASEKRHRLLFQRHPFPMWLFDVETMAILEANDAAISNYGYSEAEFLTMRVSDLLAGVEAPQIIALRSAAGGGRNHVGPHSHRRKDGTLITVEVVSEDAEVEGRPARLVLARDVTDHEILEGQLRQAQKMEAVGQLAGGIAHDFNNLLTAIRGYSDILMESLAPNDTRREDVGEISKAAERASGLTRQLLAFSRKQILQPRVVNINEVVAGLSSMLRRLIGEDIEMLTRTAPAVGQVAADVGQLEQVLVNLAVNARDAMPKGGRLTLETADVELDDQYGSRHGATVPAGPYVMLAVSDTGIGMDRETRARVFEPFFTTKETGKGTGLGLSTVYGIVKQSGGFVWVYSEPGQGTTFKIYLPRLTSDARSVAPIPELTPESSGNETILLVEDEETVRNLATRILRKQGYTVLSARHGREAEGIAGEYRHDIHLVITDVVMPEMGGRDLAASLGALRPDVPILYVSGYTDDEIIRRGVLEPTMAFIEKPFTANALLRKVREMLDSRPRMSSAQ
ncbi:MAG: PAS domain S-box protein [Gemmatimonadaceae bacterium]